MRIMRKARVFFLFLLVAGAGVSLCVAEVFSHDYRVGTWKTAQTIQPFFYDEYMHEGDTLSVFSFTNPADQKTALLAGSLDMCGTTIAHAIHAASRGEPVVVVAALCNKGSALVVRQGEAICDVADLRGTRIGYVPGTMHEILLRETLTRRGISPGKDVRLMRVDFFDMGTALARGNIDAFLSGEPFPTRAVVEGYGTILSYPYFGESIGTINAGMIVRERTVKEHPGRVITLVRAHARATEYLRTHPEEWLKRASAFGTPVEILRQAASNMELVWFMDEAFVEKARALGRRMEDLGIITGQPDYRRLFDCGFVNEIKGEITP